MYFTDALYGKIELDIPKKIICSPELQRLREVRLCNINSPYITGGTSLNRFEHAIGTAYLAQEIVPTLAKNKKDQEAFIIASLLHDIVTASFGHSLEYLFEALRNTSYEHANIWQMIFSGKTIPSSRYFFCEKKSLLHTLINQKCLETVQSILESRHQLARYLINLIDIDNIDNVFRFAFHVGIAFDKKIPLQLARTLKFKNEKLLADSDSLKNLSVWYDVRRSLYKYLLEDEGEFVAKALLERSFIEAIKENKLSEMDWVLTDTQMIYYIIKNGNAIAKSSMQKLMMMDFPEIKEIYFVSDYRKADSLLKKEKMNLIEHAFKNKVYLHFIRDVNKTNRTLKVFLQDERMREVTIGTADDRYLIGVFSDSRTKLNEVLSIFKKFDLQLERLNERLDEKQISLF